MRRALANDGTINVSDQEARAVPDEELPVYTVLVPAYREPEVIAAVVASVASLDYPADRLEVLLLLEEDDATTIAAARTACAGTPVEIVLVPAGEPRTKPRACNYGLMLSSGEFITIFDVEDRPEVLQLRRAVVAFRRSRADIACLQARLSYHNAEQNLITRWFTTEYDTWFQWLLPGLVATGAPIPLGGTSNHIRREVLWDVGGWDPYNVTEDADLGVRLARYGWSVAILDSTTHEEANSDFVNWIKQRSRWYKGYLQTVLVHIRSPRRLINDLGAKGAAGFLLFVGGTPLLAMLNPVFWGLTALWWLNRPSFMAELFPAPVYYIGMACWVLGGFSLVYFGVANARSSGKPQLAFSGLMVPLYWPMMSLAAIKAFVQLVFQPSYWEKTTHGLFQAGSVRSDQPPPKQNTQPLIAPESSLARGQEAEQAVTAVETASPPTGRHQSRRRRITAARLPGSGGSRAEHCVFFGFLTLYIVVGCWLIFGQHSVMGDALSRVANANYVLYSREPKLANIGFVWTPLPSLLFLPFLPLKHLWPPLVEQGLLANIVSAIAMASSTRVLCGLLSELHVSRRVRIWLTVAFGLQPMIIWFGANGMTEALLIVFLLLAIRRLVRWTANMNPRHLMAAGGFLALGYLARYEVLAAGCAAMALVFALSWCRSPGGRAQRRRAAMVDALLVGGPLMAAFALWAIASWVIVSHPFEQFSSVYGNSALVQKGGGNASTDPSLLAMQWLILTPLLVPVLVAAIFLAVRRHDVSLVAPVGLLSAVLAFQVAAYFSGSLFGFLRYQIVVVPMLAVLVGYLYRQNQPIAVILEGRRREWLAGLTAAALMIPGILTSGYAAMMKPEFATEEWNHVRPAVLASLGHPQPVTGSYNGAFEIDREVAAHLDARRLPPGSVVVDSGPGFAVLVASANPRQFVITSDRDFEGAVTDPVGHNIQYLLVSSDHSQHDEVAATWPDLARSSASPFWAEVDVVFASHNHPKTHGWTLWRVRSMP
ncbi:Glycosyltransferase, catalytic subunit of cellulose synthase and poly-beta-1,6-N-acetylglucosamine synthase [Kibdelosporangium aridum]|uniref:Glycosyltransferase, catalytic subunit of cellulose synthase and poly-beta-1,6-N-acetylglucosamine synthase n=1 Tax=Kibdelosporangium aridum TaxID=2030 RepID=A0A1Y5Y8L2_KIBAR|nr:Glycosyltransferase, catalytic subunit of cellulose synthase and poly-beta-1,6-N-acetylglucosamine synthase [Kibdelosporangium aridum]